MTDDDFRRAIRRLRLRHWLHYAGQTLLMGTVVLLGGRQAAPGTALEPRLATWPALLLLGALLPLVGLLTYVVFRRLKPNLRRPAEQNMRVYQSRMLLRDSLLILLALPLLVSFVLTHHALDLALCAGILVAMGWQTVPSAAVYQRWLLS